MANKNETRRPSSGLLFYGLMLVVLVVLASVFWGSNYGTREQNTLSDVLQTINSEDNDVSMVEVNGTTVTVKYKASGAQYESEMTQQVPYEYVDDLIEKLEKAKDAGQIKDYTYVEPFDWGTLIQVIVMLGSVVLVVFIFLSMSRQGKDSN